MNIEKYINIISKRLESYFEIKHNYTLYNKPVDLFAVSKISMGRTMITHKDVIDSYDSIEYVVIKHYKNLNESVIDEFQNYLIELNEKLIKPSISHKSSYINGVLVCDNDIEDKNTENLQKIKKFKYEKVYKWYFHGFSQVRIFTVGLSKDSIISNKSGKRFKKVYKPTP